ncbi:M23 family metallopeptidase [Chloroflexota bacterium]
MKLRVYYISSSIISLILLSTLILALVFAKPSEYCSESKNINLSDANLYADDASLPFRFPVDNITQDQLLGAVFTSYGYSSSSPNSKEYHAAEDYHQPAGSPVYAMAEGIVSFSGPMGGYGWLIIIDHPDLNLYSLYGHLSPSRWYITSGPVQKGQLIAYLGDPDENGGSKKNPLIPHLHFGIRSGQKADYPSMGEWRWQAGWIKYCPQDLGWLQPTIVISDQELPKAGFQNPESAFLAVWWQEILLSVIILIGAITTLLVTTMKDNIPLVIGYGIALPVITWFTFNKGLLISYVLLALFVVFIIIRLFTLVRQKQISRLNKSAQE